MSGAGHDIGFRVASLPAGDFTSNFSQATVTDPGTLTNTYLTPQSQGELADILGAEAANATQA